jgi:hypothetical protein
MDYFRYYSSRELQILNIWAERSSFIPQGTKIIPDNTAYHDARVTLPDGTQFLVQVKEEETKWYNRTGNIGLDFISAFMFKDSEFENLYLNELKRWVPCEKIKTFLEQIEVLKWGKLRTRDAHVHVFYVKDKVIGGREIPLLLKTYCNSWLQSQQFIGYLISAYDLRINDKGVYGISEDWHSAAFFVKPSDPMLQKGEIATSQKLQECIRNASTAWNSS